LYENRACSWDVAHEDFMNRDKREVAYSQNDVQMSEKYRITKVLQKQIDENVQKFFPRLLRESV